MRLSSSVLKALDSVLAYWFKENSREFPASKSTMMFWYTANPTVDAHIKQQYSSLVDAVKQIAIRDVGSLLETPRTALASVICLDQFPRNIYRKSAKAFEYDEVARLVCTRAIDMKLDEQLRGLEKQFLYMPLMHSEQLRDHELLIEKITQMQAIYKDPGLNEFMVYAEKHKHLIEEYGRYPYRNAVLERKNTEKEEAFLKDAHDTFGQ